MQIKDNYIIPALIGIPLNIIIIISIFISANDSVLILAIGSVIAIASQLFLLIPFIKKKGFKYKLIFELKDKHIKKLAIIALPVILGVSVNQINILVDRTLASQIATGGISSINYALRLSGFVQGIFVTSIFTVIYPMISRMAAENNMEGLKKAVQNAIGSINLFVIPSTIIFLIFSEQIITFLYGRGAFDNEAIIMTSDILFFYSFGMVGIGVREVLSRAFYSLQDTKTPMKNAAFAMVINIVLNLILSRFLGLGGLALATSISAIICSILLFISLKSKIGSFGLKNLSVSFVKVCFASLIMALTVKPIYSLLTNHLGMNVSLIISLVVGSVLYFIIIHLIKVEEVKVLVSAVKRKMKR